MHSLLKQILDHEGVASIVTQHNGVPLVTATWNSYIEMEAGEKLLIPAGGLSHTEQNVLLDNKMFMLIGSKSVQGRKSMGTGVRLSGKAEFVYAGPLYDKVKKHFPWARAVLVFSIEKTEQLL